MNRRHLFGPLLRRLIRKSLALALLILLATVASPVQAQQPDPSVCNRTPQVRDAIVASVEAVSDCAYVTDAHLADIGVLNLSRISIETLQEGDFAGLTNLSQLLLYNNSLEALSAGVFSGLTALVLLNLSNNSLEALPAGVFSGLTALMSLYLDDNNLMELSADIFSGLPSLRILALHNNSLTALPGGVFSGLSALKALLLDENPGSEGFRLVADAGADQTAGVGQVVTLTATASDADPWGDNVSYAWTQTDNSGNVLPLMGADTASPSFVMPEGVAGLEFELRVIGRGANPDVNHVNHFVGTDSLKVRHPDAVVTLTGPEAAATTDIVENEFSLVFTYSAADLHGRILAGKIEVAAAVDGVAITPDIKIDEASGQGEITVILRRQEYPGPIGHLLAVTLSLSAAAEGFVLGEPSSITTPFSFFSSVAPSVCARTEQVRDAIVASVPVSRCADVTDVHLAGIAGLNFSGSSIETLQEGDFAGLTNLSQLELNNNRLEALPAGVFSGLTALGLLNLSNNSLAALPAGVFSGLTALGLLNLSNNSLAALPAGVFSELPTLMFLYLGDNSLAALPADVFAGLTGLMYLYLHNNSLTALPGGVFSGLPALLTLLLDGNPGSEGFRPIAIAGADQTARAAQVVILTATVSDDDPWGDNVSYAWRQTDNSGDVLPLMGAESASPSFVMPAGATGLEFELRVTGRGANGVVNYFVGTDSLKVRHPDAVVTLTGPEPAATTTNVVENSISLLYTYSAADLHGRVLTGSIEVTAAVDGVAITPTIKINGARGEITIVLEREAYPHPDGHLLAVTLSLSAAADGFVLGEPSSITTPFRFVVPVDPSVCDRTPQVRDAIVASVSVSHCAYVTDVHLAGISVLNLSGSSIETLQEGDFAGLTNLSQLLLNNNSLTELPMGIFAGLPALALLNLNNNSLEALPAGVFSELPTLRYLYLGDNSLTALPADVFADLTALEGLNLANNRLAALPASAFSGLPALVLLLLDGNPGSESFRPIADAGADQTAGADQVVTLTATASDVDPWGDNVRYVWRRTDNSGSDLTLMDAETASLSFVMPAGATGLEFELRVTGRGANGVVNYFVDTDSLKVRHPDAVVTLTGPEPAATTTNIVEDSINLVYTYSAADLHGRILTGSIEVAAAVDGAAVSPAIYVDETGGMGEITVVLRREAYPNPDGHSLTVTLSLSAAAAGFVLGEPSSMTTLFSFRAVAAPAEVAVTDTVVTLTGPEAMATTDIVDSSISLVYTYSVDSLYGRVLMGSIEVAAAVDGDAVVPALSYDDVTEGGITIVLEREAYPGPGSHSLAVTLSLSAAAAGFVLGEPSSMTTLFSFRAVAAPAEVAVTDTVVTLTGPEAMATTDIVEGSISLVYTYSADNLYGRILTGSIEVAAAVDGDAVSPAIYVNETGGMGEITVVLKRESYPGPGSHSLAVTLSLSAAAAGFVLGEPSSITTLFSFRAVAAPAEVAVTDTVVTLTGPEAMATTDIVEGSISLVYTYSADSLYGRILTGSIEVAAAVDGDAVSPAIYVDETGGMGEITVVLKRESYPAPGSHSLAVTLGLSAAAGFVLGEPSSMTTLFSFRAVAAPAEVAVTDTVVTLTGPEAMATTDIVEGSISLVYTYSVDSLYGRILTGSIEVAAAVDGDAVSPAIYVDETGGMGEITVVLKRESYPAPGSHSLAVTLGLSAAAKGFVLGEISLITTLFSFSFLSTAIAEDGTCQLGMLEPGEYCRYKGSSMIMSVPQAGSQVLFFELSGRGEPLNLKDASNPDDPDDPNVYNLHAIMVGRGYQMIRIYTSPKDFLNAEFGSMGGAAILWAALFFFADFARGLAGRRSRCPRGRRQEPGNRAGRAQARRPRLAMRFEALSASGKEN